MKPKTHSILKAVLWIILSVLTGMGNCYTLNASPKKQKINAKRKYQIAENFLNDRNYSKASVIYKELLDKSPRNPDLNFKLGVCYLNIISEKEKSVQLLEKAIQYTKSKYNVPVDFYTNLAKAYHSNYQFRDALKIYQDLYQIISPQNTEFRKEISRDIEMCENGMELVKSPVNISIVNLGDKINTIFDEHSPGITADESTMVFTSRRNGTGSKIDADGQYFEDIYISHLENGSWTSPKGIPQLNTIDHDASISISADGQEIYIYKAGYFSKKESEGGDIYVSHLKGNSWSTPEKLASTINSSSKESHISVSANGRTIFFSSNRPGGYGGMDIYTVSKLPNGKWGMAKNLGPAINTEYDDDAPFIHPDGKTLYFSSAGHKSMGGLDIFKTINIKGRWTTPVNIGYPINSTDDDVYYTPTPDGKRAYFASYRKGSVGRTDIFLIKTPDANKAGLFVLKGKVVSSSGTPVHNSKITVAKNNKTIGIYTPNSATGKFLFIIDAGQKYEIEIVAEGYRTLRTVLKVPANFANKENHSVITLLPLTLRSKDEPNYPAQLQLIDFEESKLNDVNAVLSEKDTLPDVKAFEQPATKTDSVLKPENTPKTPVALPVPAKPKLQVVDAEKLAFTLDLGKFTNPNPKLFDKLDGVTESIGPDEKYHYTYGKFKNYKEASKAQKDIVAKGFTNSTIRILSDDTLVKEKSGGETYYTIQIMALKLSVETEFFDNLSKVRAYKGADGFTRYTYKKFTSYKKAIAEMNRIIRIGYWDAFVRTVINGQLLYPGMKYSEKSNYTIQVMALRKPRPLSYFNDLENVQKFTDPYGLHRYTYGNYPNKHEAILDLGTALKKGYWDAFVRKSLRGEQLEQ